MRLKYLFWALCLFSFSFCACDIFDDENDDNDIENVDDDQNPANDDASNETDNGMPKDAEVVDAFNYLNSIRVKPSAFSKEVGYDLSSVKANSKLVWNETLAKVAQQKAEDMVKRKYFSHTDPDGIGVNYLINKSGYKLNESWYDDRSKNYFESIAAGKSTGKSTVIQLVYDSARDNETAGHRSHLLGISDWNNSLHEIGIGHAYGANTDYKHYWSFIIAKHDF